MAKTPKVCWDSCVLITILLGSDPDRTREELQALREAVTAFDSGDLIIVVPAHIHSEVLDPIEDPDIRDRFDRLLRRTNLVVQDITQEVSRISGRVRSQARAAGRSIKTADSLFIATALLHECDALHTYDGRLLRLSGSEVVDELPVVIPQVEQTELLLD